MLNDCLTVPKLHKDSSCGSVVVAALLEICTQEADMLMDLYSPKGWNGYTNVNHIRNVLDHYNIRMKKTIHDFVIFDERLYFDHPTAIFVQLEGPWVKKGWRSAYSNTHWVLGYQGFIIDINSIMHNQSGLIEWRTPVFWNMVIMKELYKSIKDCTGWSIRSAYIFEEVK